MKLGERIEERIREKLAEEIERADIDEIIDDIADAIINDEIFDTEAATKDYIREQCSDWKNSYNAEDILKEEIDKRFDY